MQSHTSNCSTVSTRREKAPRRALDTKNTGPESLPARLIVPFVASVRSGYSVQRRITSEALMPPKPKEFDSATSKLASIARLGT